MTTTTTRTVYELAAARYPERHHVRYLGLAQLAERVGLSKSHATLLRAQGKLPPEDIQVGPDARGIVTPGWATSTIDAWWPDYQVQARATQDAARRKPRARRATTTQEGPL